MVRISVISPFSNVCDRSGHLVSISLLKIFVLQIRDGENKLRPITLASIFGVWRVKCGDANCDESVTGVSFISEVSEELSVHLQSGIIKIARRALLDEIISSVISDFLKAKKSEEHLKSYPPTSAAHVVESISVGPSVYIQLKNSRGYH